MMEFFKSKVIDLQCNISFCYKKKYMLFRNLLCIAIFQLEFYGLSFQGRQQSHYEQIITGLVLISFSGKTI